MLIPIPSWPTFRALWCDRSGAYSILTALMLPVLVGFTGFGTETGLWYYEHQKMQGAADAAAYSADLAFNLGNTSAYQAEAKAIAAQYGFVDGTGGVTVTVNQPPKSGPNTATAGAVEVIVQQPQQRLFSAVLTSSALNIAARAVAVPTNGAGAANGGTACVLGLDPSASQTVLLRNNALLPNANCGVVSDSSASDGLYLWDNSVIDGSTASHGGTYLANNSQLNGTSNKTDVGAVPDPYANSNPSAPPACTTQTSSGSGVQRHPLQLQPGHFCSGFNFTNNYSVNLAPGVYYIDSQLVFGNNAVITGTGVTLVINGNYAISIGNNATVDLTAPTSGSTSGIVFFGSRNGTSTVVQDFSNNTILNLKGAVYFPNQIVNFDNNASSAGTNGCTQIVGRMVQLSNNVTLGSNCSDAGTTPIGMGGSATVTLVE
jgi:Flp pilus assembly protein TadG